MKGCLIIMPVLYRGGSEKQVRLIVDAIDKKKFPLSVIVECCDKAMKTEEHEYVDNHPNTSFIFLDSPAMDAKFSSVSKKYSMKLKSMLPLTYATINELKKKNINTVMVTNLTGLVLVPLLKLLNCEVIYNERNSGVMVSKSYWKRKLLKCCKYIVCNSKYASQHLKKMLGREIEVINNGTDLVDRSSEQKKNEGLNIIIPARISSIKNQIIIVEAVNLLKNKIKVHVIFAGVIENQTYFLELQSLIKTYELESCIDFIGFTTNIYKYYQTSDILILPSLEEGTPNVLLEAYMSKLRVLASNIPMNADCTIYKDFLFEPHDAQELADKIKWIMNIDCNYLRKVCEDNYNFVRENYSLEKMCQRYLKLLYSCK